MKRTPLVVLSAVVALAMAGCSNSGAKPGNSPQPGSYSGPADPSQPGGGAEPGGKGASKGLEPERSATGIKLGRGIRPIPPAGDGPWKRSSLNFEELAKSVDRAMGSMKDTYGEGMTIVKTPKGNGSANSVYKVRDRSHFRVDYVIVEDPLASGHILADGKAKRQMRSGQEKVKSVPIGQQLPEAKLAPSMLLDRWPREFTRLMMLNVTDAADPWFHVLSSLGRGMGGFSATVEERLLPYKGKMVKSLRVHALRSGAAAKTLGPCEIEMVFDDQRRLPVTIRVIMEDAKGATYQQQWSGGWSFGRKFKDSEFQGM